MTDTAPAVDLYEDNAGTIYLTHNGRAWGCPGATWESSEQYDFAVDAEAVATGVWEPDQEDRVKLADLIEQTHLSHDATRHVATWQAGTVTIHNRPGAAARAYLGDDAPPEN